jgi:hypothetical protein
MSNDGKIPISDSIRTIGFTFLLLFIISTCTPALIIDNFMDKLSIYIYKRIVGVRIILITTHSCSMLIGIMLCWMLRTYLPLIGCFICIISFLYLNKIINELCRRNQTNLIRNIMES